MKRAILLFVLSCGPNFAQAYPININDYNFNAPVAPGTTFVTGAQVGSIIYDAGTNQFKGLDSSGNWDSMTVSGGGSANVTSVSTGVERIERVLLNAACTSSPCSATNSSGSWFTSITRSAAGNYQISFTTGEFSGTPSCVCNNLVGNGRTCTVVTVSNTSAQIDTNFPAGSFEDDPFNMICVGPH